jgi:hypothetical protein
MRKLGLRTLSLALVCLTAVASVRLASAGCVSAGADCAPCCKHDSSTPTVLPRMPCCEHGIVQAQPRHPSTPAPQRFAVLISTLASTTLVPHFCEHTRSALIAAPVSSVPLYRKHCALLL